jgi:hypothetical protein
MATLLPPVVGAFCSRAEADRAVADLQRAGFRAEQIGVLVRDGGAAAGAPAVVDADVAPEEGAAVGAVTGGAVGGLIGAGVALTVPGIGPALAVGVLAGILGGATIGITGGGLMGALIGLGLSHEEAHYYDQEFRGGRTIVTVRADGRDAEAAAILARCGAQERRPAAGARP